MSELPSGTVFAGHRIEAVVGRGGMGVVYRATQLDLERLVALKIVAPELVQDETARRRFVQESRLAASIDHPHVIPIHRAGEEGGVPYLVMRYVAGDDGRSLVRREGPLPPERAARIVAQVADALDAAHAAGLVHRDVKPANVLLGAGDHAYLSDFGLTRHVHSISATRSGHWVGTLDYVAPEQIRGGELDARADVYALGCLLFFLLTAEVPFPGEGDEAKLWAHLTARPPRVTAVVPEVPAAFDDVIRRALAKAPDDRYPSAGDLGRAALAAAAGVTPVQPERAVARGAAAPIETPTRTSALAGRPPRRGWLIWPAALLAAGALGGVAVLVASSGDERERVGSAAAPRASPAPSREPRVVARLRTGARPTVLAASGLRLWVGTFGGDRLQAVDVRTDRTVRRLRPRTGKGTADLAVGDDVLWVAARPRRLLRLDPASGRSVAPPIDLTMRPVELAANGNDVWVALALHAGSAQIARLDAASGAVQAIVPVSSEIRGMIFARGRLWTLHAEPNFLVRRDPRTLVPKQRVDLPGRTVGSLAYGAGSVWATIPDEDQLVRYNERSRTRATVAVGSRPIGVAVRDRRVWVAASGSSTLEPVDARSLRPAGDPIRVPLNPQALLARGDTIWVTCVGVNVVVRVEAAA